MVSLSLGAMLGNRTNLPDAQAKGVATNRQAADALAANVLPIVRQIQAAGATTFRAIARLKFPRFCSDHMVANPL
jgi:hypothetical protein